MSQIFSSREVRHGSPARFLVLLAGVLLIQIALAVVVGTASLRNPVTLVVGLAVASPLIAFALFLFPRQILLFTPLLILIPGDFLSVHPFEWVFLAAFGAYVLTVAPRHFPTFRLRTIDVVFFIYIVWGLLSVTQAVDMRTALVGIKRPIIFFLAFLAGSRVLGRESMASLLKIYALVAIGAGLELLTVITVNHYSAVLLATRKTELTNLGWGVSVYVAAVSVLAACASLPAAFLAKGLSRLLAIAAVGAAAFVSLASLSRGGALGLAFGLLAATFVTTRRNFILALVLIGGMVTAYFLSPIGQATLERFGPKGLSSIGLRLLIFREAWSLALAHPILGIGPDQIPQHTYFFTGINPHNIFLKNAAEMGFVGLGLYLGILGWVVRRWFSLRREAAEGIERARVVALFLVFSVAVINASYEPTLSGPQYGFLFWLMVGSLTAPTQRDPAEASP